MSEYDVDILLVEDNQHDAEMTVRALNKANLANKLIHVKDGEEALDFIFARGEYSERPIEKRPKVIFLDIKMPKVDGIEVLRQIKANEDTKTIPVVMMTSSKEEHDIITSYNLGANSYVVKPIDFEGFAKAVTELGFYWLISNQSTIVPHNKYLEQFTYVVSHNLRAPVANIMGLSNIINSRDFDINEYPEIKTALETSINTLDQIIQDLNYILQVNSYINDKTELVLFQALVEEISVNLNNLINSENVTINTDFGAIDSIMTIKSYLYNVFYNLTLNGIKYRRNDINPVLSISTRKKGNGLEILFKDNGKGIDEKNIKNLFGLYKRFETDIEGKGIGLFMVKMQVENLGGIINVQSEPGLGTTFKIEFPNIKYSG